MHCFVGPALTWVNPVASAIFPNENIPPGVRSLWADERELLHHMKSVFRTIDKMRATAPLPQ